MRIAVAMSGGVDSSVAAFLLKERGYDLVGVTLNLLQHGGFQKSIDAAKKICEILNIPHYTISLQDTFKQQIIDYFCQEYSKGRTPNPCVRCNYVIKFSALYDEINKIDSFDMMATGHYVQTEKDPSLSRIKLIRGKDKTKDQSYFLWRLTQKMLYRTIFPLGEKTKKEVKEISKRVHLQLSQRKESQEVCFIQDSLEEFLKEHISYKPGNIVDTEGNVVGTHRGSVFYTIGQRRGLGIAMGKPVYVLTINPKENIIVIGDKSHLFHKVLIANQPNWISIEQLKKSMRVTAKIRYRHKERPATIEPINSNTVKVTFDEPQRAITPGQSVVFYNNDEVVGGGVIKYATD